MEREHTRKARVAKTELRKNRTKTNAQETMTRIYYNNRKHKTMGQMTQDHDNFLSYCYRRNKDTYELTELSESSRNRLN